MRTNFHSLRLRALTHECRFPLSARPAVFDAPKVQNPYKPIGLGGVYLQWGGLKERDPLGSQKWPNSRRAFTLVELLVVILIIAVLAALLFPLGGRFREEALASKCASNLRQIGAAVHLYANDNDGLLPSALGVNGLNILSRLGPLAPYWGYGASTPSDAYYNSAPVKCPAANRADPSHSYVCNVGILGFPEGGYRQRRVIEVENPAKKIIMGEGSSSFDVKDGSYIRKWNNTKSPTLMDVHRSALNALFLDGHVERLALESIQIEQIELKGKP